MSTKLHNINNSFTANQPPEQDNSYNLSVESQIELEELRYRAALKADETFEVVKAIRQRIKYLTRFINNDSY
jgi:hypothetical protein